MKDWKKKNTVETAMYGNKFCIISDNCLMRHIVPTMLISTTNSLPCLITCNLRCFIRKRVLWTTSNLWNQNITILGLDSCTQCHRLWLRGNRNFFLTVLETESCISGCLLDGVFVSSHCRKSELTLWPRLIRALSH